jgi:hypothetical protein
VDRYGSLQRFGKRTKADSQPVIIAGKSRKEDYKVIKEIGLWVAAESGDFLNHPGVTCGSES